MRLIELHLSNFQGINKFDLIPNGNDVTVKGKNGIGKTTIGNAISYLLTGKPTTGEKGYTPKTRDENGQDIHGLNNVVEATFSLDNGELVTFKKDYHEVYTSKRGSADKTFSGNTTDFFVDGVPVAEKVYNERLASIFPPETGKMLTTPNYFPEVLSWQDRRKTLLEICGDVTDMDVIQSNKELTELLTYLKKPGSADSYYTVDDYKAIASVENKRIKEEMATIKPRIDEAERAIPDLSLVNKAELEANLNKLNDERSELQKELSSIDADTVIMANRKELAEIQTRQVEARSAYAVESAKVNMDAEDTIRTLDKNIQSLRIQLQTLNGDKFRAENELEDIKRKRERALANYKAKQAEQYEEKGMPNLVTVCPTCGQAIPEEQLEEAREKFHKEQEESRAQFNQAKSEALAKLMAEGQKYSKDVIADKENAITKYDEDIKSVEAEIESIESNIKSIRESMVTVIPFESTDVYKELKKRADNIKALIDSRSTDVTETKRSVRLKIDAKDSEIREIQGKLAGFAIADNQHKRIVELEEREKELAKKQESIEHGIYLCDQFTVSKVSLLDGKINSHFVNVRFKMFEVQVNGGIKDVCEPLVRSTNGWMPYSSASNAERINGGLEIINVLSKYYDLQMPVVIDNAEAVCKVVNTDAQQIRLVVSDLYDTLNVTVDGEYKIA